MIVITMTILIIITQLNMDIFDLESLWKDKKIGKKRMLIYWKDKNENLYWEKVNKAEFPPMDHQHPQALLNFTHKDFKSWYNKKLEEDEIYGNPIISFKEWGDATVHYFFPLLIEDGGTLKDLDFLRTYINFPWIRKVFINSARVLYNWNPNKYFDEEQINWIRKALQTYAKVAENPIFQEVLDKYDWNE